MDDRRKTIAALTIIIGGVVFAVIVVGVLISRKKVVSPVPDEGAIKVIFISPTPIVAATQTPQVTVSPASTARPTARPTVRPSATPTSARGTPSVTPSPTPKP